jgi:hypothetical protein
MQPPEAASERIISNSELPIWLQQTDTLRPASREVLPLSPRRRSSASSTSESRLSGRRLSNSRGELFPAVPSEPTSSDGRRLFNSHGDIFPAVPSEPALSEAVLTPRTRAARAPPNPFEASWDSLEAFQRCTLARLAGEGTGSSSADTQAHDFGGGVGCGGRGGGRSGGACPGEAATAARIARRASREAPACFSVPEDAAMQARGSTPLMHGGAVGGASWASDGGPRAVGGAVGVGPIGVLASLPTGRVLQLDLLSTWGDPHYVGLTGIELFDADGEPVSFPDPREQLCAEPASVNVLPGYGNDPRVVSNLVDGVLRTCDDLHLWLTPFTRGERHVVWLDMRETRTLSMARLCSCNIP